MLLSDISNFTLFGVFQLLVAVVALAASDTRSVTNVICGALHVISTSNVAFHFADQECSHTASTVFVLQFLTNTSTSNFGLENISIDIRSVVIRGSLSVVVAKTPNSTAVDTERPSLRNFVLCLQNVSILVGTVNQSAHPNMPRLLADRKDTTSWTLLWIPLLSDPTTSRPATGLIDNLQVIMTDVVIATNTGVTSSFLDSLIVVQSTLLHNVMISIVNSSLHVNTSSTLIALYGSVNVIGLKFLSENVTLIATCASRGCIPVFIACGRDRWNQSGSTTFFLGVGDANVTIVASNVTWYVIPRPLFSRPVGVVFPVVGNAFDIGDGFCGVVAISLFQKPATNDSVTIARVLLRMHNCAVRFWIAGESAKDEVISDLDGFEVGVFVLTGHTDISDVLNDSIVQITASSVEIRAASVTIVRASYFKGGMFNGSITVEDIGPNCQLFAQVRRSTTASTVSSSVVYTVFAPIVGPLPSFIFVRRIARGLLYVQSGELVPDRYPNSSLLLIAATVVFLGPAEFATVMIDAVTISTLFENGTLMPVVLDNEVVLITLTDVASSLFASAELMGPNLTVTISNSNLHFLGANVTISTFVYFGGALNVEVAALYLMSCRNGTLVRIVDTTIIANGDAVSVQLAPPLLTVSLFFSMVSLQSFFTLFTAAIRKLAFTLRQNLSTFALIEVTGTVSASFVHIYGSCAVEQRWLSGAPSERCKSGFCIFNTSAVALGPSVDQGTEIVVENMTFSVMSFPVSLGRLVASVFSVAMDGKCTVSDRSRLVMASMSTTLSDILLVPLTALGVGDLVTSNLTFQNAEFIVRDCVINRYLSPASHIGIILSSLFPNTLGNSAIVFKQNAFVVIQRSRIFSSATTQLLFGSSEARSPAVNFWNASKIVLGCNQWNGFPFPGPETAWSSFGGVPRHARMFNESIEASSTAPRFDGCSMPLYSRLS
jgi:hypothetical protein